MGKEHGSRLGGDTVRHLPILLCFGLLACGPALDDLPNINEVEVDPEAEVARSLTPAQTAKPEGGLLAALFSKPDDATPAGEPAEEFEVTSTAKADEPPQAASNQVGGAGLSGLIRVAMPVGKNRDVAPEVAKGTLLPYGALARVCNMRRSELGTEVSRYPERGRGYRLYDTNPSSTGLRTHYITGFNDNCARQFTAALAMFGATETHEAVRYDSANRDLPFTETDAAYESLKSRICRVGQRKPCPDQRRAALDQKTVFVSVYERFLGSPRWADMLLHDGRVLAKDLKER